MPATRLRTSMQMPPAPAPVLHDPALAPATPPLPEAPINVILWRPETFGINGPEVRSTIWCENVIDEMPAPRRTSTKNVVVVRALISISSPGSRVTDPPLTSMFEPSVIVGVPVM